MQHMATPRSKLVDPVLPLHYHLVSGCVRRAWLCGRDPKSRRNYDHRKRWLEQRMFQLARYFAVEIDAFAVMSSHFHLVIYFDPVACQRWSDEEVAMRWVEAFPPIENGEVVEELKPICRQRILENKELLVDRRNKLGCLSTFMKHLKQPIARRANREDGCQGHFFESRFYSGALLSEQAVLASMAYVDLNPVRAKIARSIEQCHNTSIAVRIKHLENSIERLREVLEPLISGIGDTTHRFQITLADYIENLKEVIRVEVGRDKHQSPNKQSRWFAQVASIRKRQRAYGSIDALTQWIDARGLKRPGASLPE
jgi:REP element-mobilizing transposase RayT